MSPVADSFCALARIGQDLGESIVEEIGIEREGSLESGDCCVVPTLTKQDKSKLSPSLWHVGVEVHSRLRQFKGAIERSGTEIIAIERFEISVEVSSGQHRSGNLKAARALGAYRSAEPARAR